MEFKVVTPKKVDGLPQQPSYLQYGDSRGYMHNVRILHDGEQFRVLKCHGAIVSEEMVTPDFQEALFYAHRMWNW